MKEYRRRPTASLKTERKGIRFVAGMLKDIEAARQVTGHRNVSAFVTAAVAHAVRDVKRKGQPSKYKQAMAWLEAEIRRDPRSARLQQIVADVAAHRESLLLAVERRIAEDAAQ